MLAISLQSGSNGNCTYVESDGVRLLFDAGLSGRKAQERLAAAGVDIRRVNGLVISHDHTDHIGCAAAYQRQYGLPVYMTHGTLRAAREKFALDDLAAVKPFEAGESLKFDGVTVHTVPTPHDCEDGVGFVVEAENRRLGILTDLGHVFGALGEIVSTLDAALIESNYDPRMLESGTYPEFLKARIRGSGGHLSNVETAELLREWASDRLSWVCLAHLSEHNNAPALALETHRRVLGSTLRLMVAGRSASTGVLKV